MLKTNLRANCSTGRFLLLFHLTLIVIPTFLSIAPLCIQSSYAAQVQLEWDRSLDPNIAGYKVYYGTRSGDYSYVVDVGCTTSCVIAGLEDKRTYFFAAKAYDGFRTESDFSNEVYYFAPKRPKPQPRFASSPRP